MSAPACVWCKGSALGVVASTMMARRCRTLRAPVQEGSWDFSVFGNRGPEANPSNEGMDNCLMKFVRAGSLELGFGLGHFGADTHGRSHTLGCSEVRRLTAVRRQPLWTPCEFEGIRTSWRRLLLPVAGLIVVEVVSGGGVVGWWGGGSSGGGGGKYSSGAGAYDACCRCGSGGDLVVLVLVLALALALALAPVRVVVRARCRRRGY